MKTLFLFLCAALAGTAHAADSVTAPHVVVIVMDGLRPDLVTETATPILSHMALEGTSFSDNHAVYPSSTEVNGAALFTGDEPDHTTILANKEYRPSINPNGPFATEDLAMIRRGDYATGNHYIPIPTLVELLQREGLSTAVAGTKPVALLADRAARDATSPFPVLFKGDTLPQELLPHIVSEFGAFPATITYPNTLQDSWTTRVLCEGLWKTGVPSFSLLWLSEPDYSQHQTQPGADIAMQALHSSDQCVGQVMATLDKLGVLDQTDVIVVSDHGFSTVNRTIDLEGALNKNGFYAVRKFIEPPQKGQILVDSLGGSAFFYVVDHDPAVTQRLATYLQRTEFAGVLFSRTGLAGTFPLSAVRLSADDNPNAPDLVLSLRWTAEINRAGIPGSVIGDVGRNAAIGTHASLSRFDLHNTLIAHGPDFKSHFIDTVPSGNIDLAPTLAYLFHLRQAPPMDGRVLTEALTLPPPGSPVPHVEESKLSATAPTGGGIWSQYLVLKKVNQCVYLEEGNGN